VKNKKGVPSLPAVVCKWIFERKVNEQKEIVDGWDSSLRTVSLSNDAQNDRQRSVFW